MNLTKADITLMVSEFTDEMREHYLEMFPQFIQSEWRDMVTLAKSRFLDTLTEQQDGQCLLYAESMGFGDRGLWMNSILKEEENAIALRFELAAFWRNHRIELAALDETAADYGERVLAITIPPGERMIDLHIGTKHPELAAGLKTQLAELFESLADEPEESAEESGEEQV